MKYLRAIKIIAGSLSLAFLVGNSTLVAGASPPPTYSSLNAAKWCLPHSTLSPKSKPVCFGGSLLLGVTPARARGTPFKVVACWASAGIYLAGTTIIGAIFVGISEGGAVNAVARALSESPACG
jgi:hypothetical protein